MVGEIDVEKTLFDYSNSQRSSHLAHALIIDSHDMNVRALFRDQWEEMEKSILSLPDLGPELEAKLEPFKHITTIEAISKYLSSNETPLDDLIGLKLCRIAIEL